MMERNLHNADPRLAGILLSRPSLNQEAFSSPAIMLAENRNEKVHKKTLNKANRQFIQPVPVKFAHRKLLPVDKEIAFHIPDLSICLKQHFGHYSLY